MIRLKRRLKQLETRLKANQTENPYQVGLNLTEDEYRDLEQKYGNILDNDDDSDLPPE